jgi:hypothetical protein
MTEMLGISEFRAQAAARDWTQARAWLQCVARFFKEN